jgi:hypothetical protein
VDEGVLKRAITAFLDSAVPADAQVLDQVMARVAGRRPPRRSRHGVVLGLAAAATIAALGTAFASSANFPVLINLTPFMPHDGGAAVKKPLGGGSSDSPVKAEQQSTTIALAEAAFGHHVITPSASTRAHLRHVYFNPAAPVPSGAKPGQQPTSASVGIEYVYASTTVTVSEAFDPSSAPLTVDTIDQGGPKAKGSEGLGPVDIETVSGSPYAVLRTSVGGPVETLMWKTADGLVVTVQFSTPVSPASAFDFASGMA